MNLLPLFFNWFLVILAASLGIALVYLRSELSDARKRANTAEKAYGELSAQSSIRERALMLERDGFRSAALLRQEHWCRLENAEADADRLAPIVEQYIKDMDDTALLLKDDKAPTLAAEREALRLHHELIKSRTHK